MEDLKQTCWLIGSLFIARCTIFLKYWYKFHRDRNVIAIFKHRLKFDDSGIKEPTKISSKFIKKIVQRKYYKH